jgi:hypothetical protein
MTDSPRFRTTDLAGISGSIWTASVTKIASGLTFMVGYSRSSRLQKAQDVRFELGVRAVMVALNGRLPEGSVHPLDFTIGPGMVWLSQSVLDTVRILCPLSRPAGTLIEGKLIPYLYEIIHSPASYLVIGKAVRHGSHS